jgi:hypothetical protein
MPDSLRAVPTRLRAGWILPLALITLPNCAQIVGIDEWNVQTPSGPLPRTSVIFCEIQQKLAPGDDGCASAEDTAMGIRLEEAATALVSGQKNALGLDYSQSALDACGGPRKVPFQAHFPDGYPGCLNCSEIGPQYADPMAFCVSKCVDLTKGDTAFCNQPGVVKIATNFLPEGSACYADACLDEGTLKAGFDDPRLHPETVTWENLVNGVTANGGTLTRDSPDVGMFDAGADAPSQMITHGNAYVEFTVDGPSTSARLCGLSEGPGDTNPSVAGISFAIDLFRDGCVYIFEHGVKAPGTIQGCEATNAFGGYATGEVFRVRVTDNLDGTGEFAPMGGHATVTYTRLLSSCLDGKPCSEELLWPSQFVAQYPLRVDSSFREQGGTLTNVRIVRIRPLQ